MVSALACLVWSGASACGARTGLSVDERAIDVVDLSQPDAWDDVALDDRTLPDVPLDVPRDIPREAATPCAAGTENVFVIGTRGELYAFDPATRATRLIAVVPCSTAHGGFNSMAVARDGTAFAAGNDGSLTRIRTTDGVCETAPFADRSFGVLCMGFSLLGIDDVLFVASCHARQVRLGRVDTGTFSLTDVGAVSPPPPAGIELAGDRNGRLFGFSNAGGSITLYRLDPASAAVLEQTVLPLSWTSGAYAFVEWGGDFYFFVSQSGGSAVVHYRPADRSYSVVTHVPIEVVGAGVSTCAPGG